MDCIENFPSGLFSRKGHPAFVLTHLDFIDAGKLGKTAGIDKVEIFKERRHIIGKTLMRRVLLYCSD